MAGSRAIDERATVVRRRRRRAAFTAGAGTLVAVVVVATQMGGMPRSDRSLEPVLDPRDGRTDGRTAEDPSWAPERIRAVASIHEVDRLARGAALGGLRGTQPGSHLRPRHLRPPGGPLRL